MPPSLPDIARSENAFPVGRAPWALVIALLAVFGVEVAARSIEPRQLIPYEETGHSAYSAVRHYLDAYGPAEVAFLGSSRGREAIVCPLVRALCEQAVGRPVSVANYSSPAGSSDEMEAVTRLLLRQDRKPALILYGVSPLQLSTLAAETRHAGELWYWEDYRRERDRFPRLAEQVKRDVIQNEVERRYRTFAYRHRFLQLLRECFTGATRPSCPVAGELTDHQKTDPDTSLLTRHVTAARVREYLARRMVGNRMPLGGEASTSFESILRQCNEAGVPIIVYEVPLSGLLLEHYPRAVMPQYRRLVTAMCREARVPFIRLEDLGVALGDEHFREQSHLNYHGAAAFTPVLTERVIIPALRRFDPQDTN